MHVHMKNLLVGIICFLTMSASVIAEEITIPDLKEAVAGAQAYRQKDGSLVIKVPDRPEFEQPLLALVNRNLLIPTNRGLIFRPEATEREITVALLRQGLNVASEVQKNREYQAKVNKLEGVSSTHTNQINNLQLWMVAIAPLSIFAFIGMAFMLTNTLGAVRSRQGKFAPPVIPTLPGEEEKNTLEMDADSAIKAAYRHN